MKKQIFTLVMLAFLVIVPCFVGAAAQPQSNLDQGAAGSGGPLEDNLNSVDRKLPVNPKQPSKGINSGRIVIYGHLIPPPYALQYRGEKLFVNGIQVDPSPLTEKRNANIIIDEEMKALGNRMEKFIKTARKLYANGTIIEDIITQTQQQRGVISAESGEGNSIVLT